MNISGQFGFAGRRKPRLFVEDGVHCVDAVFVYERTRACQHLTKNDPEREDVAAEVNSLAKQLLRRHIVDRPQKRSRLGLDPQKRFLRAIGRECSLAPRNKFRQTEVQNLGVAIPSDH